MNEKLSPEFLGSVRLQSALMGLTLAFKEKYGDEALNITKTFAEQIGIMMGSDMKKGMGITGSKIEDIEKVFHGWMDPMMKPFEPHVTVEGNKMIVSRESPAKCPPMVAAERMNVPLELVCKTLAWPIFQGVARAVNPDAIYSNVEVGQQKCIETIEIP
ncbi:MAG: hypothetical protein WBA22_06150 [Candidatus Methanofastidiosia archaeon]|jgi:hypothetical protein